MASHFVNATNPCNMLWWDLLEKGPQSPHVANFFFTRKKPFPLRLPYLEAPLRYLHYSRIFCLRHTVRLGFHFELPNFLLPLNRDSLQTLQDQLARRTFGYLQPHFKDLMEARSLEELTERINATANRQRVLRAYLRTISLIEVEALLSKQHYLLNSETITEKSAGYAFFENNPHLPTLVSKSTKAPASHSAFFLNKTMLFFGKSIQHLPVSELSKLRYSTLAPKHFHLGPSVFAGVVAFNQMPFKSISKLLSEFPKNMDRAKVHNILALMLSCHVPGKQGQRENLRTLKDFIWFHRHNFTLKLKNINAFLEKIYGEPLHAFWKTFRLTLKTHQKNQALLLLSSTILGPLLSSRSPEAANLDTSHALLQEAALRPKSIYSQLLIFFKNEKLQKVIQLLIYNLKQQNPEFFQKASLKPIYPQGYLKEYFLAFLLQHNHQMFFVCIPKKVHGIRFTKGLQLDLGVSAKEILVLPRTHQGIWNDAAHPKKSFASGEACSLQSLFDPLPFLVLSSSF